MTCYKKPTRIQLLALVATKMAFISALVLIFLIWGTVFKLIEEVKVTRKGENKVTVWWHCVMVTGMIVLVLSNVLLMRGLIVRQTILLKSWLCLHLIVAIGQLHMFIVYLLIRQRYPECLVTLACLFWLALFLTVVYKFIIDIETTRSDLPLLAEETL